MAQISVQQFVENYKGKSVDFDHVWNEQCVDLFNFYNRDVVGGKWFGTPVTHGARDLYEVASARRDEVFAVLPPTMELQIGDAIIYGEPYGRVVENGVTKYLGHVRIYIGSGQTIEQNGRVAYTTTITPLTTKGMIGILRPKRFINNSSPQNVPTNTTNQNKHTIQKGDTFWGLEESNGWTHGTLQQLNPGLDPKTLAVGSEIVIPGQPAPQLSTSEEFYTIRDGDTFWALENARQLPHGTLQQLNAGQDPRKLQIGQRIRIK